MAYYTDFGIEKMEDIVLPFDFFSDITVGEEKLNALKDIKKQLKSLGDDITKREQKKLKEIKKEIKTLKRAFVYRNNYGFRCMHCKFKDISNQEINDEEEVFFLTGDKVYSLAAEGTYIIFEKKENGFVLTDIGYSKSNFGWLEDKIIDLIKALKLSVIILDEGDEENGFKNEEGMSRPPVNKIFVNGEQI